jgi:hypothetical protein
MTGGHKKLTFDKNSHIPLVTWLRDVQLPGDELEDMWENLSEEERDVALTYQRGFRSEFLVSKWTELTELQRLCMLTFYNVPFNFIKQQWYKFNEEQIVATSLSQKLPFSFVEERWYQLSVRAKGFVLRFQTVPQQFIMDKWGQLDLQGKDYLCLEKGKLTGNFIAEHWDELTEWQRALCKHNGFMGEVSLDHLPTLLTDPDPVIRTAAKIQAETLGGNCYEMS